MRKGTEGVCRGSGKTESNKEYLKGLLWIQLGKDKELKGQRGQILSGLREKDLELSGAVYGLELPSRPSDQMRWKDWSTGGRIRRLRCSRCLSGSFRENFPAGC